MIKLKYAQQPRWYHNAMKTCILAAGGTFDKHYNPLSGTLEFGQSHLPEILINARLHSDIRLEVVMQIDSLDMQDNHRAQLCDRCNAVQEDCIVIVHGTDTMTSTAEALGKAGIKKIVVITGAMVPYAIEKSDAQTNLGFALGCAPLLPVGVYIAMNGAVHLWDKVRKNRTLGLFESI